MKTKKALKFIYIAMVQVFLQNIPTVERHVELTSALYIGVFPKYFH